MTDESPAHVLGISFEKHATIQADVVRLDAKGTQIDIEDLQLKTPLIGTFNAYNTVQALIACTALGLDGKQVTKALEKCKGAPGRMERVNRQDDLDQEPVVIVDYAHTPDALKNVSKTLYDLKSESEKLVIVFGCGGDRDKSKRAEMAKIAEKYGDVVIVTSDNPRTEDPEVIIEHILNGFEDRAKVFSNPMRKEAIHKAISEASAGDIVLIAGKGHETYQEIDGVRSHFDDREVAREALAARRASLSTKKGEN